MYSVFTIISQWNEKCEYMRLTSYTSVLFDGGRFHNKFANHLLVGWLGEGR
jgi:hypothetical protein